MSFVPACSTITCARSQIMWLIIRAITSSDATTLVSKTCQGTNSYSQGGETVTTKVKMLRLGFAVGVAVLFKTIDNVMVGRRLHGPVI